MARIFTTPETQAAAKSFMHDVMVAAGIRKSQRQNTSHNFNYPAAITAAQAICDELVNRGFKNIDTSIREVASCSFQATINGGGWKSFNADKVAKAIVYMAELLNLYWDDTNVTPYEIDEFKTTILGDAVYRYGRYISAIQDPKAKSTASKSSNNAGQGAATSSTSAGSSGKPVGPQSANIRDLLDINGNPGTPGTKVFANGDVMYKIVGDKGAGKNVPNAFINPLSRSGASGNTNKVKFSSGNGWTDCTCLFDDPNEANDFLDKLLKNDQAAVNANAQIRKIPADSNGYFLVGTEYGRCAISARKMNEALAEATKLTEERGADWEKATERYSDEEVRELHNWMRRD